MNNLTNTQTANSQNGACHGLFSTGYLFDGYDYFDSLDKLSTIAQHSQVQVQEKILCCKTKLIKRSQDLEALIKLEMKLANVGLDVFIKAI